MIYHPDISVLGGIGPLWDTHKLTKSAKFNEHTLKLIRKKTVEHPITSPQIAEKAATRQHVLHTRADAHLQHAEKAETHNAFRIRGRHCRTRLH